MILYIICMIISFMVFSKRIKIKNNDYSSAFIVVSIMSFVWPLSWIAITITIGYYLWKNWKRRRIEND